MMQNKTLIFVLAAGLITPLAALADNGNFTFYGRADLSYDFVNTGDGTTTANGAAPLKGTSKQVVSSNVSRFGFKGTEDLGEGLSANWQIEQQINFDDAAKATFASRNTYASLKHEGLGTLLFGINDTPYKTSTERLNMFRDNIGDNRSLIGAPKNASGSLASTGTTGTSAFAGASSLGFDLRPTNILMYTTPAFSDTFVPALTGLSASVAKVNLTEQNYVSADKSNKLSSMAVMYDVAPFFATIAHESHKLETIAEGAKESANRVGLSYKPEVFEIGVAYEKTSDNLGAAGVNKFGHNALYVGGKYNFGLRAVKLGYTKTGVQGSGAAQIANSGARQISVGYDHGLSKRTKLYAVYTKISNGKGINYTFAQNSGAASASSGGFGASPSVLSLGVYHSF